MAKDSQSHKDGRNPRPSSSSKVHASSGDDVGRADKVSKKQTKPDVTLPGKERDVKKRKNEVDEIDDLFSTLAGKATKTAKVSAVKGDREAGGEEENKKEKKSTKLEGSKHDIFGTGVADGRKRTEEGYLIYSEDELGLGVSSKNAGYTKDCPFDCKCCF
jgi:hypothetical protein